MEFLDDLVSTIVCVVLKFNIGMGNDRTIGPSTTSKLAGGLAIKEGASECWYVPKLALSRQRWRETNGIVEGQTERLMGLLNWKGGRTQYNES